VRPENIRDVLLFPHLQKEGEKKWGASAPHFSIVDLGSS
jgi:hypothetical protein